MEVCLMSSVSDVDDVGACLMQTEREVKSKILTVRERGFGFCHLSHKLVTEPKHEGRVLEATFHSSQAEQMNRKRQGSTPSSFASFPCAEEASPLAATCDGPCPSVRALPLKTQCRTLYLDLMRI